MWCKRVEKEIAINTPSITWYSWDEECSGTLFSNNFWSFRLSPLHKETHVSGWENTCFRSTGFLHAKTNRCPSKSLVQAKEAALFSCFHLIQACLQNLLHYHTFEDLWIFKTNIKKLVSLSHWDATSALTECSNVRSTWLLLNTFEVLVTVNKDVY